MQEKKGLLQPDPEAKRRGAIQIFVPPSLKARVFEVAEARGVSVSALLGELVERSFGAASPSPSGASTETEEARAAVFAILCNTERDAETAACAAERATREARRLSQEARAARERLFPTK